jgi:hypothetical protein
VLVRRYRLHKTADCIEPFQRRADRTIEMGLDLVALSPNATAETINIYSTSCIGALGTTLPCDLPVRAFQLMPDAIGGVLVTFQRGTQMVGDSVFVQGSLARVPEGGGVSVDRNVSPGFWLQLIGQDGVALTYGDQGWQAMDVKTGEVKWSSPLTDLSPLAARPDNGLAALDVTTGELKVTDALGAVESTQPFGLEWTAVHELGDWIGIRNNELVSVVGEFQNATRFNWSGGNAQGQLTAREPGIGIFAKTHLALESPGSLSRYRHVSIRVVPHDGQHWLEKGIELRGTDEFGNAFFTFGAGLGVDDTSVACEGRLVSDLNRTADYLTPPRDPLESLPFPAAVENQVIQALLDRDAAYDDDLPYACFPERFFNQGFYNSNSYAHGLLNAAGLPTPRFPERLPGLVPGWLTPIPLSKFQ